jgi:2-iminobutanoate/2-iminopropanoate deaminase
MEKVKETFRSGPWQDIFAQGVKVGNTLHLAGQVSLNEEGKVVGENDIAEQTRQIYSNIKNVLKEFGASMDDIVDETIFVTDMKTVFDNMPAFLENRKQAFGGTPQVSQTLVQIAGLVMPELLLEIKCVAHVD